MSKTSPETPTEMFQAFVDQLRIAIQSEPSSLQARNATKAAEGHLQDFIHEVTPKPMKA